MHPNERDWLRAVELCEQLERGLPLTFRAGAQLLFTQLTERVPAARGFAMMACRDEIAATDLLSGWRPREYELLGTDAAARRKVVADWLATGQLFRDQLTVEALRRAGTGTRTHRISNWPGYRGTATGQLLDRLGCADRIWGAATLDPGTEFWLGVERTASEPPFHEGDERQLEIILRVGTRSLARWAMALGLLGASVPLTPREREVLAELLRGKSEKRIAVDLELQRSWVHQIVVAIYRKLGVSSRPELLSRWARVAAATPPAAARAR